jgi:hypothetical protein
MICRGWLGWVLRCGAFGAFRHAWRGPLRILLLRCWAGFGVPFCMEGKRTLDMSMRQ